MFTATITRFPITTDINQFINDDKPAILISRTDYDQLLAILTPEQRATLAAASFSAVEISIC
jgi:hypothetical protein